MMGDEGPRDRTAGDRLHHWRLDLKEAALIEEIADRLNQLGTHAEGLARGLVHDQIEITLAIAALGIGEPMPFLRQWPQRFGQ